VSRRYVVRCRTPLTLLLVLQIILPLGVVPPPAVAVAAEQAWLVGDRTGAATWSISSNPLQTVSDTVVPTPAAVWVVVGVAGPATVAPGETVTVTATVTNVSGEPVRWPAADWAWIGPAGGQVTGLAGRVTVALPAGAVAEPVLVEIAPAPVEVRLEARLIEAFQLTATDQAGRPVTQFGRPVSPRAVCQGRRPRYDPRGEERSSS